MRSTFRVRSAYLDSGAVFNGTSVFLRVHGREHEPQAVSIDGLPRAGMSPPRCRAPGGGIITCRRLRRTRRPPVRARSLLAREFEAGGVAHEFVVAGALPGFDGARLIEDARRICATQIAFWHGAAAEGPPFTRYPSCSTPWTRATAGSEHRASTALIANRRDLPWPCRAGRRAQRRLRQGCSAWSATSNFHAWNVKRLRPAEFATLDYTQENYTELLWFFEGFTSYYDDLLLLRAGPRRRAALPSSSSRRRRQRPRRAGTQVQSLAEASFDAWVETTAATRTRPTRPSATTRSGRWSHSHFRPELAQATRGARASTR